MRIFPSSSVRICPRCLARLRGLPASLATLVAVSLVLTACGSSGSGKTTSTRKQSSSSATVSTAKVSGYGTVLATAKGAALFMLTSDPENGSNCSGSCAKQWPPLTITGKPTAGSSASGSMLSTFKRADGTTQVLYNGHALYTHPGTTATAAAGTAADGGVWYLVSTSGKPIKSTNGSGY